ncbi:hypothetical protein QBC46DRAFT_397856 [Diplogelasinospora grovesii]|uniref:Uncharacterized protein n=1 Tax=Diplogelasinospora grovesii TaxID=303347 RepID=A0AAN6N0K4_9PEZI|nr:hypothetical protein QBC46DRAFT_397856 [Diplogelasinospora grovesii]
MLETQMQQQMRRQLQYYEQELGRQKHDHEKELQQLRAHHETEKQRDQDAFTAQMRSAMDDCKGRLQMQNEQHERRVQTVMANHQHQLRRERDEYERAVASLKADAGDHIRQPVDSDLKRMFRELRLCIEVITEPFNLGVFSLPQNSSLDPTQFLRREGKGMLRHLLRSIVWLKVVDGFFSAPFGFGAFGHGDGRKALTDLYSAWRRLFAYGKEGEPVPSADADYNIFGRNKDANRWRSATFQSIVSAVASEDGKKLSSDQAVVTPFVDNLAKVEQDILDMLNIVTNGQVGTEIKEKVSEIASLAGFLALEIGVHRACFGLSVPGRGESVQIGQEFVDCEDGDAARGEFETVDLVVCPHLFKIGDGRGDFTTLKSISPGEIYPIRT